MKEKQQILDKFGTNQDITVIKKYIRCPPLMVIRARTIIFIKNHNNMLFIVLLPKLFNNQIMFMSYKNVLQ